MNFNENDIALMCVKRLGLPASETLNVQAIIPQALNNLAQSVASDTRRRPLLLTNPSTTTLQLSQNADGSYSGDMTSLLTTPGVMLDYILYGTTWLQIKYTFIAGDVSPTPDNEIDFGGTSSFLSYPGYFVASGGLPTGLNANTLYWVIPSDASAKQFAVSYTDSQNGDEVTISSTGTGTNYLYTARQPVAISNNPGQGMNDTGLPIPYFTAWLVGTTLYANISSVATIASPTVITMSFNVPYVPTLGTFPDDLNLTSDLIDELSALYVRKDLAAPQPNAA